MRRLLLGVVLVAGPAFAQSNHSFASSTTNGRFQLVQLGEFRRDQFLLDTQTGRVWQSTCLEVKDNNCLGHTFTEMYVNNLPASNGSDPVKTNNH